MRILLPVLVRLPSARAPALQSAHMAQAFAELGHHVTVLSPAPPLAHELPDGWDPDTDTPEALLGYRPGFHTVQGARRVRRGQSITHSLRVDRLARSTDAQFILTRDLRGAVLPALRGVPTVVEVHAMSSVRRAPDRLAVLLLRRGRGYRGIVAISEPLADDLVHELEIDRAEILVAADGVRIMDASNPAAGRRAATGRPSIGYTGSLYPGKGAKTVVALAERCPWADFHLAGGPERLADELRRTSATRIPNLTVHGLLAQPATLALQSSCDILLAPFADVVRSDSGVDIARWTSPLKVFEYLASGRPSIIGDLLSLRGVVTDEVDALVVPPGDVDAFAGALERLRDDPALGERLGRTGREAAAARWTWSARAARILDHFSADVRVAGAT